MHRLFSKLTSRHESIWFDFGIIALFSFLAHGLIIYWLGFYTDDWTFLWTFSRYGAEGLTNYFSTNRPIWGLIYQVTMPLLGVQPLTWHIFAWVWGLAATFAVYRLVRISWPENRNIALLSGILFSVYPGFILQPIAITFGHIYIVYTVFILSLIFTVKAIKSPRHKLIWTIAAVTFSIINLLAMEYFYTLEVMRFALIGILLAQNLSLRNGWRKYLNVSLPYLITLIAITIWRTFFFTVQTFNYDLSLLTSLREDFWGAIVELFKTILISIYNSAIISWVYPFIEIVRAIRSTSFYYLMLLLMGIVFILILFLFWGRTSDQNKNYKHVYNNFSPLLLGLISLIMAGWPFYLTGLHVGLEGFQSRFLLPFILGASILLAAAINIIPNRIVSAGLAGLIVSGAIGYHLLTQNDFRYVTKENERLVSQLITRIPGLEPGTTILSDEGSEFFTFTTLTAQMNLIFEPLDDSSVNYGWIFPRELVERTSNPIQKGDQFEIGLVTSTFIGNSDSLVSIQQPAGGCLKVLFVGAEVEVPELKEYKVRGLSNLELIRQNSSLNPELRMYYQNLQTETWCTMYQMAELAIQTRDYKEVMEIYQQVMNLELSPYDVSEWYPFIQASASTGNLPVALTLTDQIRERRNKFEPTLCQIWQNARSSDNKDRPLFDNTLRIVGCVQSDLMQTK